MITTSNNFFSEEDDCYVADLPDFHSCSALGDAIPEPRYRPFIYLAH